MLTTALLPFQCFVWMADSIFYEVEDGCAHQEALGVWLHRWVVASDTSDASLMIDDDLPQENRAGGGAPGWQ